MKDEADTDTDTSILAPEHEQVSISLTGGCHTIRKQIRIQLLAIIDWMKDNHCFCQCDKVYLSTETPETVSRVFEPHIGPELSPRLVDHLMTHYRIHWLLMRQICVCLRSGKRLEMSAVFTGLFVTFDVVSESNELAALSKAWYANGVQLVSVLMAHWQLESKQEEAIRAVMNLEIRRTLDFMLLDLSLSLAYDYPRADEGCIAISRSQKHISDFDMSDNKRCIAILHSQKHLSYFLMSVFVEFWK
jgi:hypothetical protein